MRQEKVYLELTAAIGNVFAIVPEVGPSEPNAACVTLEVSHT